MSAFYLLCNAVQCHATESIITAVHQSNKNSRREEEAALKIQATARCMFQRNRYRTIIKRVIDVQRTYRGYLGRKAVLRVQMAKEKAFHEAYFFHFASQIQRMVRGYLLRKRHCDFYARKNYLLSVVQRSDAVRAEAQAAYEEQQLVEAEKQHAARVHEYRNATSTKHHLLSTCSVPGIYRPPLCTEGVSTVFGTNVEQDIRHQGNTAAKESMATLQQSLKVSMSGSRKFKPDLPTSSSAVMIVPSGEKSNTTASGGMNNTAASGSPLKGTASLIPHAPPKSSSLQNAVPYSFEREQLALGKSVDEKFADSLHRGVKFGVRKTDAPKFGSTINAECEFVERTAIISQRRK